MSDDEVLLTMFAQHSGNEVLLTVLHSILVMVYCTPPHNCFSDFLKILRKTSYSQKDMVESTMIQLKTILETHLQKEEEGLFPLAEKILDSEGLNNLGVEMERRKIEVREVVKDFY